MQEVRAIYEAPRRNARWNQGTEWVVSVAIPNGFQHYRFNTEDEACSFARMLEAAV